MLRSNLWVVGTAATIALSYDVTAQDKKLMPPEKWAACSSLKNEAACNAGKNCSWVVERKYEKGTVKRKAYCRSSPNAQRDDAQKK
jgi:hypothetical protein